MNLTKATLRQLKIFKAVVDNGGFSAAQAELNCSAATISIQMKELEARLVLKLCQRGRMGFQLTEQGQAVYNITKGLFQSFDSFNQGILNIHEKLVGEIRIGLQDGLAFNKNFKLPEALAQFHSRQNQVIFNVEETMSTEQETRTLGGRYHLAIGHFKHRIPGLTYQNLFQEELALYCSKGHPLFDKPDEDISWNDIKKSKVISVNSILVALPQLAHIFNQSHAIAENVDATALILLSGQYIGLLPVQLADIWVQSGQMKMLLPAETRGIIDFQIITKTGLHQSHVVEIFLEDLFKAHNLEISS